MQLLLMCFMSISLFAQNTTPEVPRNYKPKLKPIIKANDSINNGSIFPIIGVYDVTDNKGLHYETKINLDDANSGIIWITGLPQGKIKAYLMASPATYKIPSQTPLPIEASADSSTVKPSKKKPSSQINEGTLIYDKENSSLKINLGQKYNEDAPSTVFAEQESSPMPATTAKKKQSSQKKYTGIYYTGTKL